ncbi:ABC-type glycerol-3-phosphate transport system permease component [Phyllobacterium trifolii]|uniref:ABC-type glycerol-3-phosphate transport system permease component n=1 Tax=Phyllobacterium trifolii TaxID=300193 RepID=A0A839ULN3_9HYPH|nr:carbohydrate ABC transporter permease [Phyllobacterium trifolii]MBB3149612.1 ABC-type glycerol-3-phosphate transport system permease component [Phyllobacterium trifolii]
MSLRKFLPVRSGVIASLVAGLVIYTLFPVYWMVVSSVREKAKLFSTEIFPDAFSFESYRTILTLTDFPTYYLNSILVTIATTLMTIGLATPMAYALVRGKVPGAMLVVRAMLFAYMFPAMLLAIPIQVFLVHVGFDDSLISLIFAYSSFTLPLGVWMMWSFLKRFPFEIEEAAWIDGCSRWKAIYLIILPVTMPGVISVAIFSFLLAWSDFVFSLILISRDELKTLPYGLSSIVTAYDADWGVIMAGSTMISLPLLALFIFLGRYFVAGLSAGAVK